jgi:hypothetical protein
MGTQDGRSVELMNAFELKIVAGEEGLDEEFLKSKLEQCTKVTALFKLVLR